MQWRLRKSSQQVFKAISELLDGHTIALCDIGAADGLEARWKKISRVLHYVAFEPDERSDTEPDKRFAKSEVFRQAVWEHQQMLKINLAKKPQVSSVFFPNSDFVNLFPNSERFNIEGSVEIQAIKLDDLGLKACDFIKLDIQCGELSVLKGASQLLKKNIGVEIEVEFVDLYDKQPLFGEVVDFMKSHDYIFIDFINLSRWERDALSGYGQCVYGDALFLKMSETVYKLYNSNDTTVISRYLSICLLYYRFDLIDTFIKLLQREQYVKLHSFLNAIKPIRKKHLRVRWINTISSKLMRLAGGEDYRSHVIY